MEIPLFYPETGVLFFCLINQNNGNMLKTSTEKEHRPNIKYVYGLAGLAQLIGCSKPTALKIKDSGKIPFSKIGRKFIFNEEKVMDALAFNKGGAING